MGRVERRQEDLEEQVRVLGEFNAYLQNRNANLQATMEETNAVILQLLSKPRGWAPPADPAASGVMRAKFCEGCHCVGAVCKAVGRAWWSLLSTRS